MGNSSVSGPSRRRSENPPDPAAGSGSGTGAIFTVFFEGTANPIDANVTQIGVFADITNALDVSGRAAHGDLYTHALHQYKIGFDGCGVTNGTIGTIFATGLTVQCHEVCEHVKSMLSTSYAHITVNVVGLSRGGIASIYLAQMLGSYEPECVQTNLLLFDPVPGNLILSTRFLDMFGLTTASYSMDLSHCRNIKRVLGLYPYLPLPDLAFHAPVFPVYPAGIIAGTAALVEDAVLGCHQGALFVQKSRDALLSFARIREFLTECGTVLDFATPTSAGTNSRSLVSAQRLNINLSDCVQLMAAELALRTEQEGALPSERHTHSSPAGKYR
jgi:hypothetical protein